MPVVVAVHGITGSSHSWTVVARALGDRVALVALDIRGRGRSNDLPGPYGIDVHVRDILAVLDALGLDRAVLVGHSLGAYVVARIAVSHPERVHALVLVDGGLAIPGTDGVDPQAFVDAFLGPAMARLKLRFPGRDAYRDWWRAHPALSSGDRAADALLGAERGGPRRRLRAAARSGRGTQPDRERQAAVRSQGPTGRPQPDAAVRAHACPGRSRTPGRRQAALIPEVNHYTITLGTAGAVAVADAIAATANASRTPSAQD